MNTKVDLRIFKIKIKKENNCFLYEKRNRSDSCNFRKVM